MKNLKLTQKNAHWFFMAPGIVLFIIFGIYPIIYGVFLSLYSSSGASLGEFIGLQNYIKALQDPIFIQSVINIFEIFIIHAPIMIFISLFFAFLLNSKYTKFKTFFRTTLFLPNVTNAVALALFFQLFFTADGVFDQIIGFFDPSYESLNWLTQPIVAKFTVSGTIVWRWMGYNMIIFIATIQNISEDLYEAATIDGANKWKQFTKITVPLMKKPILFTTIMTVSGTVGLFAEVQMLTAGGPNYATMTPSLYIYNIAWGGGYEFGYAAALGILVSMITIVVAIIQFRLGKDD